MKVSMISQKEMQMSAVLIDKRSFLSRCQMASVKSLTANPKRF